MTGAEYDQRLRGWCSACGAYLQREHPARPILDADGTTHSHTEPWSLVPKDQAPELLPERRYALHRVGAGDYTCVSNDQRTLWRFHTYVDGHVHGLCDADGKPVAYAERTFWRAVHVDRELAAACGSWSDGLADPWLPPWVESDWYLPTRQAAINRMLRTASVDA